MVTIDVRCDGGPGDGWACRVVIREGGAAISTHLVGVRPADLDRLAPGATDPTALVESAFRFLLERELPRMILPSFDLPDIGRYFPSFERDVRGGTGTGGQGDR